MFTAIYRAATPGERWAGTLRRPVGMPQLAMLLLAAVAGHAQTGPPRGPVITNALIAGVTTTSATIVWSTDIASTSQVILTDGPSDDNTPVGRTPEDLNLVTSHRGEIPGLVPNSDYLVYVVSRGDQGTASSTFPKTLSFKTSRIDPAGPPDYELRTYGSRNVYGGADLYFVLHSTLLSGSAAHLYYNSVTGLPSSITLHLICRAYMPTLNEPNDCLQDPPTGRYFAWLGTDMDFGSEETIVRLRTQANTPPGDYAVVIATQSGSVFHNLTYRFTVNAPPGAVVPARPVIAPFIPGLRAWETAMTTLGRKWCDVSQTMAFGVESQVWYYDGGRVYQQIADYTGDPYWLSCAQNILGQYRDNVLSRDGGLQGWRVFPHGLTMNYLRNADAGSRTAVLDLAANSTYAPHSGSPGVSLIRETAYIVEAYVKEQQLTGQTDFHLAKAVDFLLGDFDTIFKSDPNAFQQSFFDGLAAEALIQYYELTGDPRIPPSIRTMLDWIWDHSWDQKTHTLKYSPLAVPGVFDTVSNNLLAPAFAWYWQLTGDNLYLTRGDEIFAHALDQDISYSGKIFSQNYHWSFDYVRWRSGAGLSATNPIANTSALIHEAPETHIGGVTPNGATIVWSTSLPSTAQVEFGLTTAYEQTTPLILSALHDHTVVLRGLRPNTVYHYRTRGVDANGDVFLSADNILRTLPLPFQIDEGAWHDSAWRLRKAVTIDHEKVGGKSVLRDFPVLISLRSGELATIHNGGDVQWTDGRDIVFADAKGVLLDSEIDTFDPVSGALTAWVRLPSLSPAVDSQFFIYFGNPLSPKRSSGAVWEAGYRAVYHFAGPGGLSAADSTSGRNDAAITNAASGTGVMGASAVFSDASVPTYLTVSADSPAIVTGSAITLETWVYPLITNEGALIGTYDGDKRKGFELSVSNESETAVPVALTVAGGGNVFTRETRQTLIRSKWSHVAATFDGSDIRIYINGQPAPAPASGTPPATLEASGLDLNIGRPSYAPHFPAYHYWGSLDEVRISSAVRSGDWIATEYRNQNSPADFAVAGLTEAAPSGTPAIQ